MNFISGLANSRFQKKIGQTSFWLRGGPPVQYKIENIFRKIKCVFDFNRSYAYLNLRQDSAENSYEVQKR